VLKYPGSENMVLTKQTIPSVSIKWTIIKWINALLNSESSQVDCFQNLNVNPENELSSLGIRFHYN
jgi:hypothetical protein